MTEVHNSAEVGALNRVLQLGAVDEIAGRATPWNIRVRIVLDSSHESILSQLRL